MSGNAEKDFSSLRRVDEMCLESLHPEIFDMWVKVKNELESIRRSLFHIFTPTKDDNDTCDICGHNFRSELHQRSRS